MERTFTCNLCEAMCGLRIEVDGARVSKIRGDPDDILSRGHLCPKAIGLGELLDDPDRLRAPMMRVGSKLRRATWDEALDDVATNLRKLRARYGRNAVALYVGNPVVHAHRGSLAATLLTLAMGTRNRFDPNSQDSNPRLFACMQMYGDALSMAVPDVERVELLLLLGANPAASNGSQIALGDPKGRFAAMRSRGARTVLVDPRRTESAAWCTEHHFIRPGGDAALLLAMLHVVFEERCFDEAQVRSIANGLDELRAIAKNFPPERVAPAIGIAASAIASLARDFASSKRACAYARVGVCQNEFGPIAAWLVEALNVVTGNFDREGGAMFPSPAVDVAPLGRLVVGNSFGRWRSRVRGLPEMLGAIPSATMIEEMETPGEGQIRALVTLAGNPVLSTPNGPRLDRALAKLDYVASIDLYVNETTRHANVILPPKHVFETGNYDMILGRFTVRNVAKYSPPIVTTEDDTRDDWTIAVDLATRLGGPTIAPFRGALRALAKGLPERIIDLLLRTGPQKTSLAKLRASPSGVDFGPLSRSRGDFVRTPDRKVRLAPSLLVADIARVATWVDAASGPDAGEPLVLIGRRHLRSNNSWMHNLRVLTKGPDRAHLMMHPTDAARLSLEEGARVRVKSHVGAVEATLTITTEVMPGVVSLPHGFGHAAMSDTMKIAGALDGPNVNALTDTAFIEPVLGTSILNGVPVEVSR